MKSDFLASIVLGLVFGICLFIADTLFPDKAFLTLSLLYVVFGLLTVLLVSSKPNIWAVMVVLVSYPFFIAIYGLEAGSSAAGIMLFIYGIIIVQSFEALISLVQDMGWLCKKLLRRKPRA